MKCSQCHFDNIDQAKYCNNCGAYMGQAPPPMNAEAPKPPRRKFHPLLIIVLVMLGGMFLLAMIVSIFQSPQEKIVRLEGVAVGVGDGCPFVFIGEEVGDASARSFSSRTIFSCGD